MLISKQALLAQLQVVDTLKQKLGFSQKPPHVAHVLKGQTELSRVTLTYSNEAHFLFQIKNCDEYRQQKHPLGHFSDVRFEGDADTGGTRVVQLAGAVA